jgi:hypothetical protein
LHIYYTAAKRDHNIGFQEKDDNIVACRKLAKIRDRNIGLRLNRVLDGCAQLDSDMGKFQADIEAEVAAVLARTPFQVRIHFVAL